MYKSFLWCILTNTNSSSTNINISVYCYVTPTLAAYIPASTWKQCVHVELPGPSVHLCTKRWYNTHTQYIDPTIYLKCTVFVAVPMQCSAQDDYGIRCRVQQLFKPSVSCYSDSLFRTCDEKLTNTYGHQTLLSNMH